LTVLGVASALRFAFEWPNNFRLLAPFVPVNESLWGHLKMAFWPACHLGPH